MKITIIIILISINVSLFAKDINLYSSRQEVLMRPLIDMFEKKTGIKVNIIAAKADQLIQRLYREADLTEADIIITNDVARLEKIKLLGLLSKINSPELDKRVSKEYRDETGLWYGLSLRARVIIYNTQLVNKDDLSGYYALANSKWKDSILIRSSSNVYNQSLIAAMILNYGKEETSLFLKSFVSNFARSPSGGDRDQIKAVASGEGKIAIVNSYYYLKMLEDTKNNMVNTNIHFPFDDKMGTHMNISGAGIITHSDNKKNAQIFLEFLLSDDAQTIYSLVNKEYPVVKNIESGVRKKSFNFVPDDINLNKLAKFNNEAIILSDKFGWK